MKCRDKHLYAKWESVHSTHVIFSFCFCGSRLASVIGLLVIGNGDGIGNGGFTLV